MSICRICSVELTDENWTPSRKNGNRKICKLCQVKVTKKSSEGRKKEIAQYKKTYAKLNKEKIKQYKHEYYLKNYGGKKGYCKGKNHYKWNGGIKLKNLRRNSKRRELGNNYLNSPLECTVGHHINMDYIIYVPIWINKIPHNVRSGKNMGYINSLTLFWLCWTGEINNCEEV